MRICIPTKDDRGLDAEPFEHFGSAPFFTLADTETGAVEVVANSDPHHGHGTCHPMSQLGDRGLDAIVCRGIGRRAFASLKSEGVGVMIASGGKVAQIVSEVQAGTLKPLTEVDACHGHGHAHSREHHHKHHRTHRHVHRHGRTGGTSRSDREGDDSPKSAP